MLLKYASRIKKFYFHKYNLLFIISQMAKTEDNPTSDSPTETRSPTAATNDPWPTGPAKTGTSGNDFEDSFVNSQDQSPFEKLPDSDSYLASLEAKLERVQKKGGLVKDLQRRREDEMRRFIDQQQGERSKKFESGLDPINKGQNVFEKTSFLVCVFFLQIVNLLILRNRFPITRFCDELHPRDKL